MGHAAEGRAGDRGTPPLPTLCASPPPHPRAHPALQLYALRLSCNLLVKVKRRELVEQQKQRAKDAAAEAAAGGGAAPAAEAGAPADGLRKRK